MLSFPFAATFYDKKPGWGRYIVEIGLTSLI
jgi:hypothetical protein